MKIILGVGLIAVLASFGAQAADDDLCSANIQKLKDSVNSAATTHPEVKDIVTQRIADAKDAQAKGDTKQCIDITSKAITKLNTYAN